MGVGRRKRKRQGEKEMWMEKKGKEGTESPNCYNAIMCGQHAAAQASWLPRGSWGCHLCSTTHTSSHNPLPLFALDQLQRLSTPNYVRSAHSSLCSKVYTSYLTFMSFSLILTSSCLIQFTVTCIYLPSSRGI